MDRPHLSEKSKQRFQLFKEQIRNELYESEEYMFSEKFKNNKVKGSKLDNVGRN